jgi:hypothetical protein
MRRLPLAALYFLALWFFLGALGLVISLVIVVVQILHVPRRFLWLTSVVLLAAAPLAILVQGLPKAAVVGGDFGARHWVSHVLVALALAFAALAAILELTGNRSSEPQDGERSVQEQT